MKKIAYDQPDGVTFYVDIDGPVLKSLFNVFLEAADDRRGQFSPLLQALKKTTPRAHRDQPFGVHSLQIENASKGSRLTVRTRAYGYTDDQLNAILDTVDDHLSAASLIVNEPGLQQYDAEKRKENGDFEPDESLKRTNPRLYEAQACLAVALATVYPGVRGHGGDIAVMDVRMDKGVVAVDLIVSGACMGCGSAGPRTMTMLRHYMAENMRKVTGLKNVTLGNFDVYSEYRLSSVAYTVTQKDVIKPNGERMPLGLRR